MFFLSRLHTAFGLSSQIKTKTIKTDPKYQDNRNQVKIMHTFGKIGLPFTCNRSSPHATPSIPRQCHRWWMFCSHGKIQCCTIYKNISGQLSRKTKFWAISLLVWRKRAGSTRTLPSSFGSIKKEKKRKKMYKSKRQIKVRPPGKLATWERTS